MVTKLRTLFTISFLLLFSLNSNAQEKEPLITGKVIISIENGTFDCDLTLNDIPNLKDYFIRLNSGMNILNFRSKELNDFLLHYRESDADTLSTGESNAYYFPDNTAKGKFLPKSIQVRYVGKFPVVKDTLDYGYVLNDWKGNIAFNGYSVRTDATQSAWYPVLYDIEKDKTYASVRYDIEVICEDCNTLYLNGSIPFKGTKSTFTSNQPQELTMYLGRYETVNIDGTYILNPDLTAEQAKELGELTNKFKKYYESHLNIPYSQNIVYVNTTPVSRENAWLFVSYPTIMNIGHEEYGLKSIFDKKKSNRKRLFIAHELGHYYFGFYKVFNSELGDMMSEGFAEYLALNIVEELLTKEVYQTKLNEKFEILKDFKAVPFAKVQSKGDYQNRNTYVYDYAPVIFKAIEKEIGRKRMWQWLQAILNTETDFTNYALLTSTLKSTIKNDKLFEQIEQKYFQSDSSIQNAIDKITKK